LCRGFGSGFARGFAGRAVGQLDGEVVEPYFALGFPVVRQPARRL
jgi:hypothetical protein